MKHLNTVLIVLMSIVLMGSVAWGGTVISTTTGGLWGATTTWVGANVPVNGDTVIIADGATVTINSSPTLNSLTVGQGTSGILTFDGTLARAVVVSGDVTVATGGTFITQSTGTVTNTMSIGGNLTNNGTFDMSRNGSTLLCTVTFTKAGDQTISGTTPVLTQFRGITLSKTAVGNRVICSIKVKMAGSQLFILTAGTWEQTADTLFEFSGSQTIATAGALVLSGSGSFNMLIAGSIAVNGVLTVNTSGSFVMGSGNNSITTVGTPAINFTAGTVSIYGRLTITLGTLTINGADVFIYPQSTNILGGTSNPFEVSGGNLTFNSGSVTLVDPIAVSTSGRDLKITTAGTVSITGGTFYLGDGVSTKISTSATYPGFMVATSPSVLNNLVLRTGGIPGRNAALKANLNVGGTLTFTSGTLDLLTSGVTLQNPIAGTATNLLGSSTGSITIAGSASDINIPSNITALNNLTINNANGTTLSGNLALSGTLTLTNGIITTGASTLTAAGAISGASGSSFVNGKLARVYAAPGSLAFPIGKGGNYNPLSLSYTALTGTSTVTAEQFESGFPGSAPAGTTPVGTRYWNVTQTGGSGYSYDITLDGTGMSFTQDPRILKHDAGTTVALATTTPNYTATGLTTLSDFAFGQVVPAPVITETGTLVDFGSVNVGSSSTEQTFTVAGTDLTANLIVTAPAHFEVSTASGSGFGPSVSLAPAGGTVGTTTIYARFSPLSAGAKSGNIACTSTGATEQDVAVSGTGIAPPVHNITQNTFYGTIQAGVDAANPGDEIDVAPGTFHEQVYVNKNLVLHGESASNTTIAPPATLMAQPFLPDRAERPIIGVGPLGTNVTIDGFTVDGEGAGNTQTGMTGIQFFKASGIIRNNTITRVRATPFDGGTYLGIFVGHTNDVVYTHSVEINNNTVTDYGKGGIVCNEAGLTANVHHNVVTGQGPVGYPMVAQNGIQFGWGATGTIAYNTISAISYTGPDWSASGIVLPATDGVIDINNNTITDAQVAVYPSQDAAYAYGSSVAMTNNTISATSTGVGLSDYYGVVTYSAGTGVVRPVQGRKSVRPASPFGMNETRRPTKRMSPMAAMTATFTGNTFTNGSPVHAGSGIFFYADGTTTQTVSMTGNTITGWMYGVIPYSGAVGAMVNTTLRQNVIAGNDTGMFDATGVLQDARENWWGDATGPKDDKTLPGTPNYSNPTGLGNWVSGFVDYSPFYLDADRTTLSIYTLTLNATTGGTATKVPDQPTYNHGTVVTLTANADPGYHFDQWSGDATGTINPLIFPMTGSKTITANFVADAGPLTITTISPLPNATAGTAYSQTLAASGGTPPYSSWQVIVGSLPSGLSLNPSTGEIGGTPTVAGTSTFTVQVSDAATLRAGGPKGRNSTMATATKELTLTVDPGALDHFAIGTIASPQMQNAPFNLVMTAKDANNNTVTGFVSTVSISLSAGTISPTTSGSFVSGERTEVVTVSTTGTGLTIGVSDGLVHNGTSNAFTVLSPVVTTIATGNWSDGATWDQGAKPGPTQSAVIASGHTVTLTANDTCASVTVNGGGVLDIAAFKLGLAGTYTLLAGAEGRMSAFNPVPGGGTTPWAFDAASTYTVGGTATGFSIGSATGITFGNLNWASSANATPPVGLVVQGNLVKSNTGQLRGGTGTAASRMIVVHGSVVVNGGFIYATNSTSPITGGFDIDGDLTINAAGTLGMNLFTGAGTVKVGGNFTVNDGGQVIPGAGSGTCLVLFKGTGSSTFDAGSVAANTFKNVTVAAGRTVTLVNHDVTIGTGYVFENDGTLNLGTNAIKGAGGFTLIAGATLGVGSPAGLASAAGTGNIQVTGTRTYDPAANYTYNGGAAQVTGDQLPATVNNLTINNALGVTLTGNVLVNGALTFTSGNLATNGNLITSAGGGPILPAGGHVVGSFAINFGTDDLPAMTFPVGTATDYTPVTLDIDGTGGSAGTFIATTTPSAHSSIGLSGLDPTKAIGRFWTVAPGTGVLGGRTYKLKVEFLPGDVPGTANPNNFIFRKYDGTWSAPTGGTYTRTATSTEYSNFTGFSDYVVGETGGTLAAGTFRSHQNGNWNDVTSWEVTDGTTWVSPVSAPPTNADGAIMIQAGHTITVTADVVEDSVFVSGTLVIGTGATFTVPTPRGTARGGIIINTGGTVTVNGTYKHDRNDGSIPIATWNTGSTCLVTGYVSGSKPNNSNQNFYNFVWNCPGQTATVDIGWYNNTIYGDISVPSTGSGRLQLTSPGAGTPNTITIMGNITFNSGQLTSNGSSSAATVLIEDHGNITVTGGNFSATRGSGPVVTWNLYGNLVMSDATTQNSNASSKFVFKNAGTQTLALTNVTFAGGGLPIEVATGTTLSTGTSIIGGSGAFTLDAGATLECGQAGGIDGLLTGTGTITLDPAANYTFNGSAAQVTGTRLPATVNSLTINNAAGVTLTDTVQVNGTLSFAAGKLNTGVNMAIVGASGSVAGADAGKYVNGNLKKTVPVVSGAGSQTYEIGDASAYTPVLIAGTSFATPFDVMASTTPGDHPGIAGSGIDATKSVNRFYTLAGVPTGPCDITFDFVAGDIDAGANTAAFIVGKYDTPTWTLPSMGTRSSTSTQVTGVSSFSDFAIGEASVAAFVVAPSSLSFGEVFVTSSKEDSVQVSNAGTAALTISGIASSLPSEFSVTEAAPVVVAPGSNVWIHVTFHPTATGLQSGDITFTHNGPSSPNLVHVEGTGFSTVTASFTLQGGWDMVSLPVLNPASAAVVDLFPSSVNNYVFEYTNRYEQRFTLENMKGYWAKFPATPASHLESATGTRDLVDSLDVGTGGWKMVGSLTNSIPTSAVTSVPESLVAGANWFKYTSRYELTTTLDPGHGYWVRSLATTAGKLYFTNSSPLRPAKQEAQPVEPSEVLNSLTITDNHGVSQTLYFGADGKQEIAVERYAMPPLPPVGGFDARFQTSDGGSMVRTHAVEVKDVVEFPVQIQSDAYPLTISWKVNKGTAAYELTDGLGGRVFRAKEMGSAGSMKIMSSNVAAFTVRSLGNGLLPKDFGLSQNYPNPFNPTTAFQYALPVDSRVTVEIYNLVGQRVRTLVNDNVPAGYHMAEWNGMSTEGQHVGSGVYFLRLSARGVNGKSFDEIRKLLLLK